jgi:hypothetical protein
MGPLSLYHSLYGGFFWNWQFVLFLFIYFLQIYNLLYKWSNKQICHKETFVRSNHPMMILLCILYVMLCVRLLFFLSNRQNCNYLSTGEPTYWPSDYNKLPDLLVPICRHESYFFSQNFIAVGMKEKNTNCQFSLYGAERYSKKISNLSWFKWGNILSTILSHQTIIFLDHSV